ncbi:MAG: hypothetical protein ACKVS8_13865 [Phycisphaerales bacterium]
MAINLHALFGKVLALASVLVAGAARADEQLDRVNAPFKVIPQDKRSDSVLLPVLITTSEAPAGLLNQINVALLPASSAPFKDAAAWAQGDPQKATLAALAKVSVERDWKKAYAFGQPYGFDGVDPDLVIAGAYTDLGDPAAIAAARHLYMPLLDRLRSLAHVEATRLAAEGKPDEAVKVLTDLVLFARQMCDRAFLVEQRWGYETMILGLHRARDVAYLDSRSGEPKMVPAAIREQLDRLMDRAKVIGSERLTLPRGDGVGAEQTLGRIFVRGAGPNASTYARTLGRVGSRQRPLRLFSESAKWDVMAAASAGDSETREALNGLVKDWSTRWQLTLFDPILKTPTAYEKLDKVRFAALDATVGDVGVLFGLRTQMLCELAGMRASLAMHAFWRANRSFPRDIGAVRPTFIDKLDNDPYLKDAKPVSFFVPMRDTTRQGNEPRPHEIRVVIGDPYPSFSVQLNDENFVMYAAGPDGVPNQCRVAGQTSEDRGSDYLLWPPVLSLARQHLADTNKLP